VRLLLDTSILLWATSDSPRLGRDGRRIIKEAEIVFVSAISLWEIAIKVAARKFDVDVDLVAAGVGRAGFVKLPVTWRHSRAVAKLPLHHHDPFDRMLVAQAVSEPLHLLTSDRTLGRYGDMILTI